MSDRGGSYFLLEPGKSGYVVHCIGSALDIGQLHHFWRLEDNHDSQWCHLEAVGGCCKKDSTMVHLRSVRYRYPKTGGLDRRTENLVEGMFGAGLTPDLSLFPGPFEDVQNLLGSVLAPRVLF